MASTSRSSWSPPPTHCNIMHNLLTDEVFNNDSTCIILNQNSVSYRNFGRCLDVVEKYSYSDVAGLRTPDFYMKMYARYEDRDAEGECIFTSPPHYIQGPTVCTLITQYGIGRSIEDNNITQKII